MICPRLRLAAPLAVGAVIGIGIDARVDAGPERVSFPENYAQGIRWLIADRVDRKERHEHYAPLAAMEAARRGAPMPSGTVFTLVRYAAERDDQGNPRRGPDGHFVKGALAGYGVMEKRTGWGSEYPESLRNGEWEYRVFTAQKIPDASMSLTACFGCHKAQASNDYVQAYDKLKDTAR
jgi:hypothetical protein